MKKSKTRINYEAYEKKVLNRLAELVKEHGAKAFVEKYDIGINDKNIYGYINGRLIMSQKKIFSVGEGLGIYD